MIDLWAHYQLNLSKEISIMVDNVRKLFSCPSMRSLLGQYRSMAQRSKSAKHRTRPMMRNLMRPLRFKKSLLAENIFLMSSSHSQGGVGAEVESWPPRKTHSRYSSWCFSWNLAYLLGHQCIWIDHLNWTDRITCQQMFVPAPRSLEYVSDRMPNVKYVHGLVTVVEGVHPVFQKYLVHFWNQLGFTMCND